MWLQMGQDSSPMAEQQREHMVNDHVTTCFPHAELAKAV